VLTKYTVQEVGTVFNVEGLTWTQQTTMKTDLSLII